MGNNCNCKDNSMEVSFIFEDGNDIYKPIKKKRYSIIKNVNNILCKCQNDLDNNKEINSSFIINSRKRKPIYSFNNNFK